MKTFSSHNDKGSTIIVFKDCIGQSGHFDTMAMKLHWSKIEFTYVWMSHIYVFK